MFSPSAHDIARFRPNEVVPILPFCTSQCTSVPMLSHPEVSHDIRHKNIITAVNLHTIDGFDFVRAILWYFDVHVNLRKPVSS